ncbi:diguanylate cyclase [Mizugakiibacter sediminis]|nr:diguanylate cyclase [Mizugakiibacter sediminis]
MSKALFAAAVMAVAAGGRAETRDPAAGFDRLADRLDNHELAVSGEAQTQRVLAELRAMLPPGDARRELRYRYLYCVLGFGNDVRAGFDYAAQGLADARKAGDAYAEANFQLCRGQYHELATTSSDALADYDAGIAIAGKLGDARLLGDALSLRGGVESLLGEHAKALADFIEAQRLYEGAHRDAAAESNLLNIAIVYRRMGDYAKAHDFLRQARDSAVRRHDIRDQYFAALQLAFLYVEEERADAAVDSARAAVDLAQRLGERGSTGLARLGLAYALNAQRGYAQALAVLKQAEADFAAVSDRSEGDMLDLNYGIAYAGLGQYERAIKMLDAAEGKLRNTNNMRYREMLYATRASVYEAMHKPAAALADYKRAMTMRETMHRMGRTQYGTWMSYQFDSQRRELENRRLIAEAALKEQRVKALERVRNWQAATLLFATLLVALLVVFVWRQHRQSRRLRRMALTDALTGIANRRQIENTLHEHVAAARQNRRPLAVLTLDVDHFKRINDTWGHQIGDDVLCCIVHACQQALRKDDALGRIGGEEFMVVLPGTSPDAAAHVAERLRASVEALDLGDIARGLKATVSIGVADLLPDDDVEMLILRADAALYRAKREGRNRVEIDAGADDAAGSQAHAAAAPVALFGNGPR